MKGNKPEESYYQREYSPNQQSTINLNDFLPPLATLIFPSPTVW